MRYSSIPTAKDPGNEAALVVRASICRFNEVVLACCLGLVAEGGGKLARRAGWCHGTLRRSARPRITRRIRATWRVLGAIVP